MPMGYSAQLFPGAVAANYLDTACSAHASELFPASLCGSLRMNSARLRFIVGDYNSFTSSLFMPCFVEGVLLETFRVEIVMVSLSFDLYMQEPL